MADEHKRNHGSIISRDDFIEHRDYSDHSGEYIRGGSHKQAADREPIGSQDSKNPQSSNDDE